MSAPPLTHHEILELVEPFTRLGRQVDLAASDRLARRLVFKPVSHAGPAALRDVLELQSLGTGTFRLTRVLTPSSGPAATLQGLGPHPGNLLEAVCAVDPQAQFGSGPGYALARSGRLMGAAAGSGSAARWLMTQGVAHVGGLTVTLNVPDTRGVSADVVLRPAGGAPALALPDDLLAVLGWNWSRLVADGQGWTGKLRLYGQPQRRGRAAADALQRAAVHLAHTLAQPPAAFHDRHRLQRWGAVGRRAIPLVTAVALVVAVLALPRVSVERTPGLWVLMFHVPVVLIALSFCLQDLARLEVPPRPRRDASPTWQRASAASPLATRRRARWPWRRARRHDGAGAAAP